MEGVFFGEAGSGGKFLGGGIRIGDEELGRNLSTTHRIECLSCPRISPRSVGVQFGLWGAVVSAAGATGVAQKQHLFSLRGSRKKECGVETSYLPWWDLAISAVDSQLFALVGPRMCAVACQLFAMVGPRMCAVACQLFAMEGPRGVR